jgi:uncharacterized protein (DUF2249 family)
MSPEPSQSEARAGRNAGAGDADAAAPEPDVVLDLRACEPPEPMRQALQALATLGAGQRLVLQTRFNPIFLLEQLAARGFAWDSREHRNAGWETVIRHARPTPAGEGAEL